MWVWTEPGQLLDKFCIASPSDCSSLAVQVEEAPSWNLAPVPLAAHQRCMPCILSHRRLSSPARKRLSIRHRAPPRAHPLRVTEIETAGV